MITRALQRGPLAASRAWSAAPRAFHTSPSALNDKPTADAAPAPPSGKSRGFLSSIMYGSEAAQADGDIRAPQQGQHSKLVGRGKYVHEKITHAVHPAKREAYLAAAEKYFATLVKDSAQLGNVKLCGSWETIVGAVGNFTHILEYDGYAGWDETRHRVLKHETLQAQMKDIVPHLTSRQHQLISEFSFLPLSPPGAYTHDDGGIYEMRTYQLLPGKLLEWEVAWKRGIEARKRFIDPVGAFFAQVGQLHEVHHIWAFKDMAERKATREKAWTVGSWSDTVQETVRLTQSMKTTIMVPTKWSPLR